MGGTEKLHKLTHTALDTPGALGVDFWFCNTLEDDRERGQTWERRPPTRLMR